MGASGGTRKNSWGRSWEIDLNILGIRKATSKSLRTSLYRLVSDEDVVIVRKMGKTEKEDKKCRIKSKLD